MSAMANETEVKYKVASFSGVRRRLRALGAQYRQTVIQTDTYIDTRGGSLRKLDSCLRLRRVRYLRRGDARRDDRPELTFKGPIRRTARVKIRKEVQTRVDCGEAMLEILASCGLAPRLTIQKRRAGYRLGPCLVELDELPIIGRFVEVEGPGERAVHAAAAKLHLPGEPITDPYVNLLRAACSRVGRKCREVTFENCTHGRKGR
jgi:adenylate cyclase class 2